MFCRFGSWGRTRNQHRIRIPQFSFGLFSTPSTLRIHSFRDPLASLCVAGSRTGQTISLCVVLATNVGDREIERPGQLPTDPIQGIDESSRPRYMPESFWLSLQQ